jgi:hypothetical protein
MALMRDDDSGVIEFLDADDSIFRGTDAAAFSDPHVADDQPDGEATTQPRGRWVVPAFAALFAIFAASIVVAAASDNRVAEIAAPTTAAITPEVSLPSRTVELDPPPFIADAPPGFTLEFADRFESTPTDAQGAPDMEVWATTEALTPGSVAALRAWFAVTRGPIESQSPMLVGAYRMMVGDVAVLVAPPTQRRRTTTVQFEQDGQVVRIDSFGWYARPLQRLINFIAEGGTDYSQSFITTDHSPLYRGRRQPMVELTTSVRQRLIYAERSSGFKQTVQLTVGPATDVWLGATAIALTDREDVAVRVSGFDGSGVFGRSIDDPDSNVLQWVVNGWLLTARGALDRDALVAFAESSHAATQEQYDQFTDVVALSTNDESAAVSWDATLIATPPSIGTTGYLIEFVSATTAAERRLQMILERTNHGSIQTGGQWRSTIAFLPPDRPLIESIADGAMTVVVASAPPASGATQLRVNVTGNDQVVIPLAQVGTADDPLVGTHIFTTAAPFTAQLVDASGTILQNWPDTSAG